MEGMDVLETLGSANSWYIFSQWNAEVSWGSGMRSWTDTAANVATDAENKPVYNFVVDARSGIR